MNDGRSIANYRGLDDFTPAQLQAIEDKLGETARYLAARGIGFVFIVAPDKVTLYPELMPDSIHKVKNTNRSDQLAALTGFPSTDLRPALSWAKARHAAYTQHGTHWTSYGALVGYLELLKAIHQRHPEIPLRSESDFEVRDLMSTDDSMLDWVGLGRIIPGRDASVTLPAPSAAERKLGKLLCFRDSFFERLQPFLGLTFQTIVDQHHGPSFTLDKEQIEREKPDFVILEITERF